MTNNTSEYRLADVKRTQGVVRTVGYPKIKKVARNLRINLNIFTEWKTRNKKIKNVFSILLGK